MAISYRSYSGARKYSIAPKLLGWREKAIEVSEYVLQHDNNLHSAVEHFGLRIETITKMIQFAGTKVFKKLHKGAGHGLSSGHPRQKRFRNTSRNLSFG